MLDQLGIDYVIDDDLVRGLDYYTGVIFEFMVEDKSLWESATTILGGGRYDHLVEEFNGPATPAVGFGIGEERLMLVLEKQNPALFENRGIDFFITNIGDGTAQNRPLLHDAGGNHLRTRRHACAHRHGDDRRLVRPLRHRAHRRGNKEDRPSG